MEVLAGDAGNTSRDLFKANYLAAFNESKAAKNAALRARRLAAAAQSPSLPAAPRRRHPLNMPEPRRAVTRPAPVPRPIATVEADDRELPYAEAPVPRHLAARRGRARRRGLLRSQPPARRRRVDFSRVVVLSD